MKQIVLTVILGPEMGRRLEVPPAGATLGRSSRMADLCLPDGMLSRIHCRFFLEDGRPMAQDLGSSNGTALNGRPLGADPAVLAEGDVVTVGETALRVTLEGEATPAATPPPGPSPEPPAAGTPAPDAPVDLGLSEAPAEGAPARRGPLLGLLAGLAAIALLAVGAWLFLRQGAAPAPDAARALPAAEAVPFEFRYERLAIDDRTLFRYTLTFDNSGRLALAIDDLGAEDRSFSKEKTLGPQARAALRREIVSSRYAAIPLLYPERSESGALERRTLTLVFGPEIWARTAENVANRAFDRLCERLETFARTELGAWGTQYSVAELRARGEEQLRVARRYWEQRELADDYLFKSVSAYRAGLSYLETLNPKPAFAADLEAGLREAEALLDERHRAALFAVDQALNTQRYDEAIAALRGILRLIPDRDDPRNAEASERLLSLENRYKKGGR